MTINAKRAALLREQLVKYGAPQQCAVCGADANRWEERWVDQDGTGYSYWRFAEQQDGAWVAWDDRDDPHWLDRKPFWIGPLVNGKCRRCQGIQTRAEREQAIATLEAAALAAWNAGEPRRVG